MPRGELNVPRCAVAAQMMIERNEHDRPYKPRSWREFRQFTIKHSGIEAPDVNAFNRLTSRMAATVQV